MEQVKQVEKESPARTVRAGERDGCYVYCLALNGEEMSLGAIGIEGQEVHTVVFKDLSALVHRGLSQPYQSDNSAIAGTWVMAHHHVVETAWKRWGAVLPIAFNTIIVSGPMEEDAEQNLSAWMREEHRKLKERLASLRGKVEYGVQVFWDPALVARKVAHESPEIGRMEEESLSKTRGLAYMHRQRLAYRLKQEMEAKASEQFRELYERLRHHALGIRVEKLKETAQARQMIINLSCLIAAEQHFELEALAAEVGEREGYSVRLVGPLPPYSFC